MYGVETLLMKDKFVGSGVIDSLLSNVIGLARRYINTGMAKENRAPSGVSLWRAKGRASGLPSMSTLR